MKKVAIIGAGITGLTLAYYLKKAGIPFCVFEKENHIGGVIKTESKNDFLFERGPNSGVLSNLELWQLLEDLKEDCQIAIGNPLAAKRLIWKNNKWNALPSSIITAIKTPLFSFTDKLRVLGEPFRKKGINPDENLAEMVKRRLGNSFLDYAIDPFISGIYAGNPEYLIPKYALPKLYNLEQEYGSFIKGAIGKKKTVSKEEASKITKEIFSFKGGLIDLIQALEKQIGLENIKLNQSLVITPNQNGFTIDNETFSTVVSTVNAKAIPKIFPFLAKEKTAAIINLQYAKVVEASIGFKNWKGIKLDAFGGLVPMKAEKNILGVLFMSTIFENRAPKNGALFTVFVGGTRKEALTQLNDKELKATIAKDFKTMLQLNDFKPDLFELSRYDKAIAQYGLDSKARFEAITQLEKEYQGLHLAGSMRNGVGIADRIKQAVDLAKKIQNS
jgi:oxygen-dependent protoporphyrinogen oxidase